ncbi:Fumarate lyase superfamily signature [Propionibacterium ruminifibrarum]|uniref:Fumarate lyase superfamily signature n=1 Tax=Propionibacterium ruminifibrarum TaxID=1962131 RepID=A0A375I2H5_9ACTN|nr:adenylosuccinate lyase family protein [Propionibacterium ruminifibrarum]SPF67509.1 Fumarate lyase superfamily signature [Propionibacterium ruminifibrarum]
MSQLVPFSLLWQNAADRVQTDIFSEDSCIESWLCVERALATAQASLGVIEQSDAEAIVRAARIENIDRDQLWEDAKNVGYPILGLVRQISAHCPAGPDGRVHYGATTQDIMDTGLALQMSRSLVALDAQLQRLGDALARHVAEHARTVMPGRTHAQQAVPTTFGATLATLLGQVQRQRVRLQQAQERIAVVSLFGAGGTNAAEGPRSVEIRTRMAAELGLADTAVPWHVDRDVLSEYGWVCAAICGSCAKFGRNIVDLSRTEVGEVFEPFNSHRGASSTMPQKVNPISSELMIGIGAVAGSLTSGLVRIQEAGHERAAGEWQAEWFLVPTLGCLAGAALGEAIVVAEGLRVDPQRMLDNLDLDGGLIMAEAMMIQLAPAMGREHAHDLVYEAAERARAQKRTLHEIMPVVAAEQGKSELLPEHLIRPAEYVGEAEHTVATAISQWESTRPLPEPPAITDLSR